MSALKDGSNKVKPLVETIPVPKGPVLPVRSFAQWGYYSLISLALLFSTIQKANGKNRWSTPSVKAEQAASIEMCQIPQTQTPSEKSSCGTEGIPQSSVREQQVSSNNPKNSRQMLNWN